jgi:putative SOS response-associated peptidase YedK
MCYGQDKVVDKMYIVLYFYSTEYQEKLSSIYTFGFPTTQPQHSHIEYHRMPRILPV